MIKEPRKFSIEEYSQIIRKNGNKTYHKDWDLFIFVYGGKKADIIKTKYREFYADNADKEIESEQDKIMQAITQRVENNWLKYID